MYRDRTGPFRSRELLSFLTAERGETQKRSLAPPFLSSPLLSSSPPAPLLSIVLSPDERINHATSPRARFARSRFPCLWPFHDLSIPCCIINPRISTFELFEIILLNALQNCYFWFRVSNSNRKSLDSISPTRK